MCDLEYTKVFEFSIRGCRHRCSDLYSILLGNTLICLQCICKDSFTAAFVKGSCIFFLIYGCRSICTLLSICNIQAAGRDISLFFRSVCILIFDPAPDTIYGSCTLYLIQFQHFADNFSIFLSRIIQNAAVRCYFHFFLIYRQNLIFAVQCLRLHISYDLFSFRLCLHLTPAIVTDRRLFYLVSQCCCHKLRTAVRGHGINTCYSGCHIKCFLICCYLNRIPLTIICLKCLDRLIFLLCRFQHCIIIRNFAINQGCMT